jgi:hypothetical protein
LIYTKALDKKSLPYSTEKIKRMPPSFATSSVNYEQGIRSFSISDLGDFDPNLQIANVFEGGASNTPSIDFKLNSLSVDLLKAPLGNSLDGLSSVALLEEVLGNVHRSTTGSGSYGEAMRRMGMNPAKRSSKTGLAPIKIAIPSDSPLPPKAMKSKSKKFVETIRDTDVLSGRGGKSNHHTGNKKYRQSILEMKINYCNIQSKAEKTGISKHIVAGVLNYGGRFLKLDNSTGRYYISTQKN